MIFGYLQCMERLITILALLILQLPTFAQTCCSGGVPISGNIGLPATDGKVWQLSLSYDLNALNTLKEGTTELNDNARKRLTHAMMLQAGYALTDRIAIDGFFSFIRQEREIERFGNRELKYTQGLGDMVLLFKYRVTSPSSPNTLQLGLGPKIPVGASDKKDQTGTIQNADLQPGSGSWDAVFWGSYAHQPSFRPSMGISLISTYRLTGENDDYLGSLTYEFGEEFQAILTFSDRVNVKTLLIDPSLAFRYRKVAEDENEGVRLPSTGGEWIFIVPRLSFNISQNFAYQAGVELPIYSNVYGTQVTPTFRVSTGIYWRIPTSKKNTLINLKEL